MTLTELELMSLAATEQQLVIDDVAFVARFERIARLFPDEPAGVEPGRPRVARNRAGAALLAAAVVMVAGVLLLAVVADFCAALLRDAPHALAG